ncbi:hypothetical protein HJFPF1_08869 [Paramyrothecium foliicola]|nr:hypothetical protein HJFPF1_08869 [Paramyrothecium foliicola]
MSETTDNPLDALVSEDDDQTGVGQSENGDSDVSSFDGSDYDSDDSEAESRLATYWPGDCAKTCLPRFAELSYKSHDRKLELRRAQAHIRNVTSQYIARGVTIRDLERQLAELQIGGRRKTRVTWPELLRQHFSPLPGALNWVEIYRQSCFQSNMSPLLRKVHPDIELVEFDGGIDSHSDTSSATQTSRQVSPSPTSPGVGSPQGDFPKLPFEAIVEILRLALVFPGQKIHALSRLDYFEAPDTMPLDSTGRVALLRRFHIGGGRVNVTNAKAPEEILAPLLGRFASGIKARLQRIQHIELLWAGSQYLTYVINDRGKSISRRTHALAWLPQAIRLQTIGVHLQESSKEYMRRKNETSGTIAYMKIETYKQPNYRMNRALRDLQGLDYLLALRGVQSVTFWDFDQWLKNRKKEQPVRDFTFVMDVNNSVQRPKEAHKQELTRLRNLCPLFGGPRQEGDDDETATPDTHNANSWVVTEELWQIMEANDKYGVPLVHNDPDIEMQQAPQSPGTDQQAGSETEERESDSGDDDSDSRNDETSSSGSGDSGSGDDHDGPGFGLAVPTDAPSDPNRTSDIEMEHDDDFHHFGGGSASNHDEDDNDDNEDHQHGTTSAVHLYNSDRARTNFSRLGSEVSESIDLTGAESEDEDGDADNEDNDEDDEMHDNRTVVEMNQVVVDLTDDDSGPSSANDADVTSPDRHRRTESSTAGENHGNNPEGSLFVGGGSTPRQPRVWPQQLPYRPGFPKRELSGSLTPTTARTREGSGLFTSPTRYNVTTESPTPTDGRGTTTSVDRSMGRASVTSVAGSRYTSIQPIGGSDIMARVSRTPSTARSLIASTPDQQASRRQTTILRTGFANASISLSPENGSSRVTSVARSPPIGDQPTEVVSDNEDSGNSGQTPKRPRLS